MLYIKTDTRELTINNENGERYFDAILQMMLDEKRKPVGMEAPAATVKVPLIKTLNPEVKEEEPGYRGFMHITCSRCGRTKTFYSKEKRTVYRCCDCGKETELTEMRKAYTSCECGQDSYYLTNVKDDLIDIPCVNCGAPVTVGWNGFEEKYETIAEEGK